MKSKRFNPNEDGLHLRGGEVVEFEDKRNVDHFLERLDTKEVKRRDFVRLTGATLAAVSGGWLAAACGTSGKSGSSSSVAAVASGGKPQGKLADLILLQNQYQTIMSHAGKQIGKVLGLEYASADINESPVTQTNTAQEFMARGFNMVWYSGTDGSEVKSIATALGKSKAYGSNMWGAGPWYMPVDSNNYYAVFWDLHDPNNIYNSTKAMLAEADKRLNGKSGTAFHISGFPGATLTTLRSLGVHQALAAYPNIKLVGEQTGKWDPLVAQKAVQDLASRHGKPDCICVSNGGMTTGVIAAVGGLGWHAGEDVLISSQDGNSDILQAVKAGKVFSDGAPSAQLFALHPIVRMYDVMHGVQFTPVERQMFVNSGVVTKDNVDGFLSRYYGSNDTLPLDPKKASRVHNANGWDPQASIEPIDIDLYFTRAGIKKPAGYKLPADYQAAVAKKDLAKYKALYAKQNKIKPDDSSFKGLNVPV